MDAYLVDSVVLILMELSAYRDRHRKIAVENAIEVYGLLPSFWQKLEETEVLHEDEFLSNAKKAFNKVSRCLSYQDNEDSQVLLEAVDALGFFSSCHNSEAIIFIRELCLNKLQALHTSDSFEFKQAVASLLRMDASSAIRICAFPTSRPNQLQSEFFHTSPVALKDVLKHSIDLPDSASSTLCYDISRNTSALRKSVESASGDILPITETVNYQALLRTSVALENHKENYLSVDILANIFSILLLHVGEQAPLLMRIRRIVEIAISRADRLSDLPSPIHSGLSLLNKINSTHQLTILPSLLREIELLFSDKFEARVIPQRLSDKPVQIKVLQGWPLDTLVAIFCSSDQVDIVSSRLRLTWIKALEERGIPYLFVVGEGKDTIHERVLSLNVSDQNDKQTDKTLHCLEWLYKNTEYEYIIKVDKDTVLDVDKYFGSLCYRKYAYYGHRLETTDLDRTLHSINCNLPKEKKGLEWTPIPSIYASGRLGYSLSRHAIGQLLKEAETYDGQVIRRFSYHEDKAIGNLLAKASIRPAQEGFFGFEHRKLSSKAVPVAMHNNSFFPWALQYHKSCLL